MSQTATTNSSVDLFRKISKTTCSVQISPKRRDIIVAIWHFLGLMEISLHVIFGVHFGGFFLSGEEIYYVVKIITPYCNFFFCQKKNIDKSDGSEPPFAFKCTKEGVCESVPLSLDRTVYNFGTKGIAPVLFRDSFEKFFIWGNTNTDKSWDDKMIALPFEIVNYVDNYKKAIENENLTEIIEMSSRLRKFEGSLRDLCEKLREPQTKSLASLNKLLAKA